MMRRGSRFGLLCLSLAARRCISGSAGTSYCAGSSGAYQTLSDDFTLDKVLVIHRHGDRAQISTSIGPLWPEDQAITSFWETKMPTITSRKTMATAFQSSAEGAVTLDDHLYAGEDKGRMPYAMLSELGVNQLIEVGRHLRERYVHSGFMTGDYAKSKEEVYIRSTNMCRTLQSLRGLVAGLYDLDGDIHDSALLKKEALQVDTRTKEHETMFPKGACAGIVQRRAEVLTPEQYHESTTDYAGLERKVRKVLGTASEDSVNWLTTKEILTCHRVHGREYIPAITEAEEDRVSDIAGWMWGKLYNDDILNRLAIGRFLREMLDDLSTVHNDKKLLVYSGHDSTLVPLLCALRIYDNKWPPYASYLTLEIATHKSSGEKFVRANYNDAALPMLGQEEELIPLSVFEARLSSLSISEEEYQKAFDPSTAQQSLAFMQEMARNRAEVAATTGGK